MINFSKENDHTLTSIEPRGYIHFTCPAQPTMELRSYEVPKRCPVCMRLNPIKMGVIDALDEDLDWVTA